MRTWRARLYEAVIELLENDLVSLKDKRERVFTLANYTGDDQVRQEMRALLSEMA
jgi:hypothetical protein